MKKTIYIILGALSLSSCNYLEIEPVGKVIPHKTSEFRGLLTEGYDRFPLREAKSYTGLLSDEVGFFNEGNIFDASDAIALGYNYIWQYSRQMKEYPYDQYYRAIFQANAVIANVMQADKDSSESREQLLGEAYALRAYAHFDLVNLYAAPYNAQTASTDRAVPLATYIDIEQHYRRASVEAVYTQIVDDLGKAEDLMDVTKQTDSKLNYRFSLSAVKAFKARVKLYTGLWQEAYDLAKEILPEYNLVDLNGTLDNEGVLQLPAAESLPWTGTSPEAIMALERPFSGANQDLLGGSLISNKILDLFTNDNRSTYFKKIDVLDANYNPIYSGYGVKRNASSDRASIRIAEMYLIAAEAGAHLTGELSNAKEFLLDLQAKRFKTAAMPDQRTKVEAMNAEQLLAEIADERAREFLLEGHRWMDLRRTTQPEIVKTFKEQTYTLRARDSRYTLPFPQSAIDANPDLSE